MNAILLAAGFGSRLHPITNTTPKCLVPIRGKELLGIWIEKLLKLKIERVLVNTHYLSSKVEFFLDKQRYSEYVDIAYEKKLLGTAGTLIQNISFFNGRDGMLIHADNYCTDTLEGLIDAHKNRPINCDLTMLVFETSEPSSCGIVEVDNNGVLIGFHEKVVSPPSNLANAAIYIFSVNALVEIRNLYGDAKEFTVDILPSFIGRVYTHKTKNFFLDIGTLENYKLAQTITQNYTLQSIAPIKKIKKTFK
jgi:mannose-1-phosphate guanylyltransferase